MGKKVLLIFGSSRSNGTTKFIVNELFKNREVEFIDLLEQDISYFDYEHANSNDDFLQIAEKMVGYQDLIFVTPVYWFSMSAVMKNFFDRLTDLLQIRKDLGRKLKDKNTYFIASGTDKKLPTGFQVPFVRTSKHFEMNFRGFFYHYVMEEKKFNENCREEARKFVELIYP
ncbi:MAG: NAD(P)H-dependent oxidoreductase [Nanoarchaeota archaeon]|nr:NAD(P)H-dependent oxidoreductase [Nanoarchaeota archaeon]